MNKFGWFMCGMFGMGMIVVMMLSYHNLVRVDAIISLFIIGIGGIGLATLTQKERKS